MKIKKVRKQEWSLNFHDKPKSQNPTYCFFFFLSELRVSTALLIILQSLLALYQLLLHKKSLLLFLWLASHFTENLEQIRTHSPYFYFAFSVLWSSPVEQLIKSEVLITPFTTSYNGCHSIL